MTAGGGVQGAAPQLSDRFEFEQFVETGSADVDYGADSGRLIDAGFAMRFRGNLGVGVSVTSVTGDRHARVRGRIPHPFDFGRFRDVEGDAPGLDRSELGVHIHVDYARHLTRRLRLTVGGGPSFFTAKQRLVDEVLFTHAFPYDTATFTGVNSSRVRGSGAGFNAGVDATWMMAKRIGVGGLVRFTRGSVELETSDGRAVKTDSGGLQTSAGLRVFF